MRFTNVMVMLAVGAVCAPALVVGCGGDEDTTSGSGASSSGGSQFPCEPTDPVCRQVESECVALADNSTATTFGLRMAQLVVTQPTTLGTGAVGGIVSDGVKMKLEQCNLDGTGTFSWLLQFDTTTGKLLTGGAKPVADPTSGFCFVNETVNGTPIAPVSVDAKLMGGAFSAVAGSVTVPIYLDDAASSAVLLPLQDASLTGTLSADNNCIGKFNYETLKVEDNCFGTPTNPAFTNAGTLSGFITLEDADKIPLSIGGTLCTLLAGETGMACKRTDGMTIDFKGDWCSTTKMAADAMCADAVQLKAEYAASGVKVNGDCK